MQRIPSSFLYPPTDLMLHAPNLQEQLFSAILIDDYYEAENLLVQKAQPHQEGRDGVTPLQFAALHNRSRILSMMTRFVDMAKLNPSCNGDGYLLFHAIRDGNTRFLRIWHRYGYSLNLQDPNTGDSVLHCAAQAALPSAYDNSIYRFFPAMESTMFTPKSVQDNLSVEFLLDSGVDPNMRNHRGLTPLHSLVYSTGEAGRMDPLGLVRRIFSALAHYNANMNAVDSEGRTPLHAAYRSGNYHFMPYLVHFGADINMEDNEGRTIFDHIKAKLQDGDRLFNHTHAIQLYEPMRLIVYHAVAIKMVDIKVNKSAQSRMIKMGDWLNFMLNLNMGLSLHYKKLMSSASLSTFTTKCTKEKEKLKETSFNGTTSLYRIIANSDHEMCRLLKTPQLEELSRKEDYTKAFPIYCHFLDRRFKAGIRRKTLIYSGREALRASCLPVPDLCLETILSYYNNDDLAEFIKKWEAEQVEQVEEILDSSLKVEEEP